MTGDALGTPHRRCSIDLNRITFGLGKYEASTARRQELRKGFFLDRAAPKGGKAVAAPAPHALHTDRSLPTRCGTRITGEPCVERMVNRV